MKAVCGSVCCAAPMMLNAQTQLHHYDATILYQHTLHIAMAATQHAIVALVFGSLCCVVLSVDSVSAAASV